MSDLRWTDRDGAEGLLTTDPLTCDMGEDGTALCVVAIPHDADTGGVFVTEENARAIVDFLTTRLQEAAASSPVDKRRPGA